MKSLNYWAIIFKHNAHFKNSAFEPYSTMYICSKILRNEIIELLSNHACMCDFLALSVSLTLRCVYREFAQRMYTQPPGSTADLQYHSGIVEPLPANDNASNLWHQRRVILIRVLNQKLTTLEAYISERRQNDEKPVDHAKSIALQSRNQFFI